MFYTFATYEYKIQRARTYTYKDPKLSLVRTESSWGRKPLLLVMEPPDDDNGVARGAQKLPVVGRRLEMIGLLVVMTDS